VEKYGCDLSNVSKFILSGCTGGKKLEVKVIGGVRLLLKKEKA